MEVLYADYKQVNKEMNAFNISGKLSPEIEALINSEINKKTGNYDTKRTIVLLIASTVIPVS